MTSWYIFLTTLLALIANCIVFWLKSVWKQYRNPMSFYKEMTLLQERDIEEKTGQQSKLDITDNYSTEVKFSDIFKDSQFMLETIILVLVPLPLNPLKGIINPTFSMEAPNWVDYGDTYEQHTTIYTIPYLTSDVFLALMTLRVYFILKTISAFSPVNHLFGKRVCFEAGFDADVFFLLRVGLEKKPVRFYATLSACCIFVFATCIRIFERPYYTFVLEPPTYDFKDYYSSIWFTVMSMLSAGYGDMLPATPLGRLVCITAVITGEIIIALLIALVESAYHMDENRITAISDIEEAKLNARVCRYALELNVLRRRRYRMLNNPDENEYMPTNEDLIAKRDQLEDAIALLKY